jgi:hypothetical protein
MQIRYAIDRFDAGKGHFYGSIISSGIIDLVPMLDDEIAGEEKMKGSSFIGEICSQVVKLIAQGHTVGIAGLFTVIPVISGEFSDQDDHFDPNRHSIEAVIIPGERLKHLERVNDVVVVKGFRTLRIEDSFRRLYPRKKENLFWSGDGLSCMSRLRKVSR